MRKTLIALAAAGTLLVGACGDDGGDDEEAGDTSSSMPEQSGEHREFCTQLLDSMSGAGGQAPSGLPDLEAPPEIAEDYDLMQQAYQRISEIDPNAPDFQQQQEAIQEELGGQERFNEAQQNMTEFIMNNCNMPNEESVDTSAPEGGSDSSETTEGG
jgi:hypothetical protein